MNPETIQQLIRHCRGWGNRHGGHDLTYNRWDHTYGCSSCPGIRVRP